MNRLLFTGLALTMLAGSAFAQQPPAPPPPGEPPVADQQAPPPPPPPGGPDGMTAPGEPHGPAGGPPRGPERGEFGFRGHRPPPPPSKAAHFRIEDGDTRIDIKCADDEPTKVCADLLLQVIDKLGAPTQL
jgi:hypothetical protein